jgi:hypothetical protein
MSSSAYTVPCFAFGGPRHLSPSAASFAQSVASVLLMSGARIVTGCATGADAAAVQALCAHPSRTAGAVMACHGAMPLGSSAGAPEGAGPHSAWAGTLHAYQLGVPVRFWAGGRAALPLFVRLAARTASVVAAATAGGVLITNGPVGKGSALFASRVAARGLPLYIVPIPGTKPVVPVALAGSGSLAPVTSGPLRSINAVQWQPPQLQLAV